jgi:DNA repair exonuclease SbcCD ATPase subunit
MAKNEKRPNVLLTTLSNGYALTVDKKEYMAFDVGGMLAQVFTHIALHENDYMEANYVKSLFEVASAWPDHKDAYIAVAEQMTIVKDQQKTINHLYKRLSDIGKEKDDVESKLADALEQVEKYANRVEDLARNLVKRDEEIAALKKDIEEESITVKPKSPPRVARKRADPKPRPEPKTATEKKAKVKELKKEKDEKEKEAKTAKAEKQKEYNEKHKDAKKSNTIVKIPYSKKAYKALMTPLTIDKLGLSTKVVNILKIAGATTELNHTIADIAKLTRRQLLLTRGCGNNAADDIERWLTKHGLALHMDVQHILDEYIKYEKQKSF